jgi:hypothetical protein
LKLPLSTPRSLADLPADCEGQLATEWALITVTIIVPIMALVPTMLGMIQSYFYRVAEVICLPFP